MTRNFTHVHASGFYDGDIKTLRNDLTRYAFGHRAEIITGTECALPVRKEVVQEFKEHYGMSITSLTYSDDCYIMWNKESWKKIYTETFKTTDIQFYNTKGRKRDPQYAKIAVLEHKYTGKRVLITVVHMPSSVQAGSGWSNVIRRVAAWQDGARKWKRRRNQLSKQYKCEAMIVVADWNIDLKNKYFQGVIKALQPRMRTTWNLRNLPSAGTHGRRLIDFTLLRGDIRSVGNPTILEKTKASDHRAYVEELRITLT